MRPRLSRSAAIAIACVAILGVSADADDLNTSSRPAAHEVWIQQEDVDGHTWNDIQVRPAQREPAAGALAAGRRASHYVVTDPGDAPDDSIQDGVLSPATFRAAIENANYFPGRDTIEFAVVLVSVASALPFCTDPVEVVGDFYTTIDGSAIVPTVTFEAGISLDVGASGSVIKDLIFQGFPDAGILIKTSNVQVYNCKIRENDGPGILGNSATNNLIGDTTFLYGNYIYDNTGGAGDGIQFQIDCHDNVFRGNVVGPGNSRRGIHIIDGNRNRIDFNAIYGNFWDGVRLGEIDSLPSTANSVRSNLIGRTDAAQDSTYGNGYGNTGEGISIRYSESDTIAFNTVSGNKGYGLEFATTGSHAAIYGNKIGIDSSRTVALGNGTWGAVIRGTANSIFVNRISGNGTSGLSLDGDSNSVFSNTLGSDSPSLNIGNNSFGMFATGDFNTITGNVVSGNGLGGIILAGFGSTDNRISSNSIGTDTTGLLTIPNGGTGILVRDSASGTRVIANRILSNAEDGILVRTGNGRPRGTVIDGNLIGEAGNASSGNGRDGIRVESGVGTVIGDEDSNSISNLISSNVADGIHIVNGDSTIILSDTLGFNGDAGIRIDTGRLISVVGTLIAQNGGHGIHIVHGDSTTVTNSEVWLNGGSGVRIDSGSGHAVTASVIVENGESGIHIVHGNSTTIANDSIATNTGAGICIDSGSFNAVTACVVDRNGAHGVTLSGQSNRVGGPLVSDGNQISQNDSSGVIVQGAGSSDNVVQFNVIGTDTLGVAALPNLGPGITVRDSTWGTQILDNRIAANMLDGVRLTYGPGGYPYATTINRNTIGSLALDTLGNKRDGIRMERAHGTVIGGTIPGLDYNYIRNNAGAGVHILHGDSTTIVNDTIWINGGAGVQIDTGMYNQVFANSLYDNGGLGIDLGGDGVSANDVDDADTGANMLQNYPTLSLVTVVAGTTHIVGELDGDPDASYIIDVYASPSCDSSGYGEGAMWVGTSNITTPASGIGALNFDIPYAFDPNSEVLTLTATDSLDNTSEFSSCYQMGLVAADIALEKTAASDSVALADTLIYTLRIINRGPDSATGVHLTDSLPAGASYLIHTIDRGTSSYLAGVLECDPGTMQPGDTVIATLTVIADSTGQLVNRALAYANESDAVPQNNVSFATVEVVLTVAVEGDGGTLPHEFALLQNHPNPFNPATTIAYQVPRAAHVRLEVLNVLGQHVATIMDRNVAPGSYEIIWDGRNDQGVPTGSGLFFYRLVTPDVVLTRKMLLLR